MDMDRRQWIEPGGASFFGLSSLAQVMPNGYSIVVPWVGGPYSQPPVQGFIPDTLGAQWNVDVQNLLDQSVGIVTAFPSPSHANFGGDHDTIGHATATIDTQRPLNRLVPQRVYADNRRNHNFRPDPSIYFNTPFGLGFPAKDALDRNFNALVGREDPMSLYRTAISLRFEFEGYESRTYQIKTRDSRRIPHPIPREKLAQEVAKRLVIFLKERQATPGQISNDAITTVDVQDLALVRLDHVSKASWQPQFMIVRDA